jgi:phospholipase C
VTSHLTRSDLLTLAAGATVAGVRAEPLPPPHEAPFDTVVVLMMENRSFDHVLGDGTREAALNG